MLRPTASVAAVGVVLVLAALVSPAAAACTQSAVLTVTPQNITLSNGFTEAVFDVDTTSLSLAADVTGHGNYSAVLTAPLRTELVIEGSSVFAQGGVVTVLANTPQLASIAVSGIAVPALAGNGAPAVLETWTLSLASCERSLVLNLAGEVKRNITAKAVLHSVGLAGESLYGFFDSGVVQLMNGGGEIFVASGSLARLYAMGGAPGSSVDMKQEVHTADWTRVVMASQVEALGPSGLQEAVAGSFSGTEDAWLANGWANSSAAPIAAGTAWNVTWHMAPNNRNFPVGSLPARAGPSDEDEVILTGSYGSTPGCLRSYPGQVVSGVHVAQVSPTIRHPTEGYRGTYNYFDPDMYFGLGALILTGDPYLQEQARLVMERSGSFLMPTGQLPHHFKLDQPVFTALSGETQTGPNIFWTSTALAYARYSGNTAWLRRYMPKLRLSLSFCTKLIDPATHLILAPGSLMIDVFIRANYTSDTNAMVVGFLRDFAEAEEYLGNSTGATTLRTLADRMADAVNARVWDAASGDHYLTQRNPDGTFRDFVDYDSNLIAVAHGLPPNASVAARILERVDRGKCSNAAGGGSQWVSEVYYGKADTTHGQVGDSCCAMARIGWFDALSRKRVRRQADLTYFNDRILEPLIRDVKNYTWLYERYGCDGLQQLNRTQFYFEYPSVAAMMIHRIRYGIDIGLINVTVDPWGVTGFDFGGYGGGLAIASAGDAFSYSIPGQGTRNFEWTGLVANAKYTVTSTGKDCKSPASIVADSYGTARFVSAVGQCAFKATTEQ